MANRSILYSREGHVARIALNRPEASNRLTTAMVGELEDVCRQVTEDDDIYVAVLTGAGAAFCSGAEAEATGAAAAIARLDRVTIAAINGDSLGEGLELALACDIRVASEKARFGLPQVAAGLIPADGGTQRLPRIVGRAKALELILTAETIGAREALEIGLVSRVVPAGNLAGEVDALATAVAAKAPISLRYVKEAVNKGLDRTLDQGLLLEADLYFLLHTTEDRTEGIRSFLQKRQPHFKGE